MLKCREASELTSRSLDSDLPWHEKTALRVHLAICRMCRRFRDQLFFLKKTGGRLAEHLDDPFEPDDRLADSARQRISELIDQELPEKD